MRRPRLLRDVGEHAWLRALLPRLRASSRVVVGPGDDAAVVRWSARPLVLTVDALVEGRHFRPGWESPAALGRRALRVNVSDVAAMGATPRLALVAVAAPPTLQARVLDGLMAGLAADAAALGIDVVGGNLSAADRLAVTVTLVGELRGQPLTRAGARAGDEVWVTGSLGGAGAAVRALARGARMRRPPVPVRVDVGARLAPLAHAAIDVSDGLVQDLGHVCRASRVGAVVELARLPIAPACRRAAGDAAPLVAATAGEDYELLVVVPPSRARRLAALGARLRCPLTRVGRIVAGRPQVRVVDGRGAEVALPAGGFDHFR